MRRESSDQEGAEGLTDVQILQTCQIRDGRGEGSIETKTREIATRPQEETKSRGSKRLREGDGAGEGREDSVDRGSVQTGEAAIKIARDSSP